MPVPSSVDYVNRALRLLGGETITALTLEDSPTAAVAVDIYDPAVRELLAKHPWRFATTRIQLAEVNEDLPGGSPWSHQYAIPTSTLRLVRTDKTSASYELFSAPGEVDGGGMQLRMYTDETVVWADVTRVVDPELFPPMFQKALVMRLASELAMPVTRRPDIEQLFEQRAVQAEADAIVHDWNQAPWYELDDGNILADARFG